MFNCRLIQFFQAFICTSLVFASLPGHAFSDPSDRVVRELGASMKTYWIQPGMSRLSHVADTCVGCANATAADRAEAEVCSAFYHKMLTDKTVIRIQVSFGYADVSEGQPYRFGSYDLGYNASLDNGIYWAFRQTLTDRCYGRLQVCGFKEVQPGFYKKTVTGPYGTVEIQLHAGDASLTPYYQTNSVERRDTQIEKSRLARDAYMTALETDDVILYVGHSRNGGGPDFQLPVLLDTGHPDYAGYYQAQEPGVHDFLASLQRRGSGPPLMGFHSCLSEHWFGESLMNQVPDSGFVFTSSNGLTGMNDNVSGALAVIDSVLRFQCYSGFQEELNRSALTQPRDNLRNFLTNSQPVHLNEPVVISGD